MLRRVIEGRWLTANGAIGFWPANGVGDALPKLVSSEAAHAPPPFFFVPGFIFGLQKFGSHFAGSWPPLRL